jgi:tryptophan synthase alpha chain
MSAPARVSNQLDEAIERLRKQGSLALVMYLTAGFPDAASTLRWGPLLAESGASIIELGVPFSDPLGDGPTIQRSSQRALEAGMTMRDSLEIASSIRTRVSTPVVMMSYCNPIFKMGVTPFAAAAAAAGVTGVIVPDLPLEEAGALRGALAESGVHLIYLLSPATTGARIAATAKAATGFIYCMAVTGVTGARASLSEALPSFLARVRELTDVPLVVGFGISRPEHLAQLRGHADGAVVASALVDLVERTAPEKRDDAIAGFVRELHASCSGS